MYQQWKMMANFNYNESNTFLIHVIIYVLQFCVLTARIIKEELNLVSTQTAMNSLVSLLKSWTPTRSTDRALCLVEEKSKLHSWSIRTEVFPCARVKSIAVTLEMSIFLTWWLFSIQLVEYLFGELWLSEIDEHVHGMAVWFKPHPWSVFKASVWM